MIMQLNNYLYYWALILPHKVMFVRDMWQRKFQTDKNIFLRKQVQAEREIDIEYRNDIENIIKGKHKANWKLKCYNLKEFLLAFSSFGSIFMDVEILSWWKFIFIFSAATTNFKMRDKTIKMLLWACLMFMELSKVSGINF